MHESGAKLGQGESPVGVFAIIQGAQNTATLQKTFTMTSEYAIPTSVLITEKFRTDNKSSVRTLPGLAKIPGRFPSYMQEVKFWSVKWGSKDRPGYCGDIKSCKTDRLEILLHVFNPCDHSCVTLTWLCTIAMLKTLTLGLYNENKVGSGGRLSIS